MTPAHDVLTQWELSEVAQTFIVNVLERCQFPTNELVLGDDDASTSQRHPATARGHLDCAVSGGADSIALMVLARAGGFDVTAWHIDHGIRDGSHAEADFVAAVAQRFGALFESRTVTLAPGSDLEARARTARHEALPAGVLFGHTAEDLAETVILRLMRGTGPTGIAAMTPTQHPLLQIRREETEQLCALLNVNPVEDPSNKSPEFQRNRVRYELLPLMADIADRDVVPLLTRFAELAGDQRDYIAIQAADLDATDVHVLRAAHPVVAHEALRQWWLQVTKSPYPPDLGALQRMMAVVHGVVIGCDVVSGWHLSRSQGKLSLQQLFPNEGDRG